METKISLVPTRVLFPQPKKEKKITITRSPTTSTSTTKTYRKVYNEKPSSTRASDDSRLSPKSQSPEPEYSFQCDFPKAEDYSEMANIIKKFPHLKDVNKSNLQVDKLTDLKCFIMRSNNEDDIHKAIKYGIWTSTPRSNEFLNSMYRECSAKGVPIYLFFSVVRSGQFSAVAQMNSGIQEKHFQFWWEGNKWMNYFEVKWVFIKDMPYRFFDSFLMDDGTSVIRARDCTSTPVETSKQMLKLFRDYQSSSNIFEAFSYMDIREDMLRSYRYALQSYQKRLLAKKSAREAHSKPNSQHGSSSESLDYLTQLLREFESTLGFYQREQTKLQEEVDEIVRMINLNEYLQLEDMADWLTDYQDLKRREKELEEGLEDVNGQYKAICKYVTDSKKPRGCGINEKEETKVQEAEKVYRSLEDKFAETKGKMDFFTNKIMQLNSKFSHYNYQNINGSNPLNPLSNVYYQCSYGLNF